MIFTKADGAKIRMVFDNNFINDFDAPLGYAYKTPEAVLSAYSTYTTSRPLSNLVDGSTSTYWETRTFAECWIKLAYDKPKLVSGWRWYIGSSSYYPTSMQLQGSDDDSVWIDIGAVQTGSSTVGWQEYTLNNSVKYQYYRINITATSSTARLYIYELQMYEATYNEEHFTVGAQEYTYVPGGTLVETFYTVDTVELESGCTDTIILTVKPRERFESAVGDITVAYDGLGNLAGLGGAVIAFAETFTPADLIPKPNQNDAENISVSVSATGDLIHIDYTDMKSDAENISVSVSATGALIHIDDI